MYNVILKALWFFLCVMFLGIPTLIMILLCHSYLNDISYSGSFWQYSASILSSSENPLKIVFGLIMNFPFSEILNTFDVAWIGDLIEFEKAPSFSSKIVDKSSVRAHIFIGLVQLSLAQLINFLFSRLKKVSEDNTFKCAYYYVSIFFVTLSFTVSAVILKLIYLWVDSRYLKIVFLLVLFSSYFLHAILVAIGDSIDTFLIALTSVGLDLIFFFIQSVLLWFLVVNMLNMFAGSALSSFMICFIIYLIFLILKEVITKNLLHAMN